MPISKKDRFLEILYHLCFIIYTTLSIFAFSPVIYKLSAYVTQKELFTAANWGTVTVLAVIYLLKRHESKKEILAELFVAAVFFAATFTNQTVDNVFRLTQWTMFFTVGMFIICATVTTLKRIATTSFVTTVITVASYAIASNSGHLEKLVTNHGGRDAHYLGFYYYTHPSYYMLFAWLAYMYIRGEKKICWLELLIEAAVLYKLHDYTTCRLATVCTFVALILYIVFVKFDLIKLHWKFTHIVSVAGFSLAAVFTFLSGFFFNPSNAIMSKVNRILSGRLSLVGKAFDRYDIQLFGRLIKPLENEAYFYLDACYAYALFGCGVVFFIVVLFMYSYMCHHACKTNDRCLLVLLATLAIFGIVGDVWVHISYTPAILGFFIFAREASANKKTKNNTVLSNDMANSQ